MSRDVDWHDEQAKGCDAKTAMGREAARNVAARARADGNPLTAYRCPWSSSGDRGHWHVGHVPCIERIQEIADAIRARAQDPAA